MPHAKSSTRRFLGALLHVCLIALALSVGHSIAAPPVASHAQATESQTAVQTGVQMERTRQWLQAIEHYEDALKQWPGDKQLQYGLRRSKIHFSIERRYTDRSFESALLSKSRYEALDLFDDVLDQISVYYVEPVSATSFVAHGTESLYLALANDKFVERNISSADGESIRRLRTTLREQFWNKQVNGSAHARQTVSNVCDIAESHLGVSGSSVVMEYIFGGCNALDDYSSYLTPDRLNDLYGNIEGEFVGLGIEMKSELGQGMLLVNVLQNSPAEEGGLVRGEHIVGIDGRDCRHMTTDEAARLLRGPSGSQVLLEVQNPRDEIRSCDVRRRAVHVKSIPVARMLDRQAGIAYIQMTGFQKTSPSEIDEALWKLRQQGMRALIWDLRGNPGGLLTAAWEVLDRFVDDGVLVSTHGRTQDQNWVYRAHRPRTWRIPLVLLVDGESASASEIVAGAVRDHNRGIIVGRQTYGKWSVQSIFPLPGATGLRLTTAKFYSPKGRTLGKIGVKPDVVVARADEQTTYFRGPLDIASIDSDEDVRKGLEVIRGQISRR